MDLHQREKFPRTQIAICAMRQTPSGDPGGREEFLGEDQLLPCLWADGFRNEAVRCQDGYVLDERRTRTQFWQAYAHKRTRTQRDRKRDREIEIEICHYCYLYKPVQNKPFL